jgi:hypothetical protein
MTASTVDTHPATQPGVGQDRRRLLVVALVLGAVGDAVLFVWRPGTQRDALDYADIAPVRDATWLTGVLDAVASGLALTAFAIGVCVLVTRRGRTLATIGAAFTIFGHILLSAGVFAVGVLFWYATEPDALSEEAGTELLDYFQDHLGHLIGPQFVGFASTALGVLIMAGALWRSRVVPRWYPVVLVLGLVVQGAGTGRVLDFLQAAAVLSLAILGWFLWAGDSSVRQERTRRPD